MKKHLLFSRAIARLRALMIAYRAVQDEAAIESIRRISVTFWFLAPLEVVLAVWYRNYKVPADQPEALVWANSLFLLHAITAVATLLLTLVGVRLLRREKLDTRFAVVLQILLSLTCLMYGVAVSYFDIAVGGTQAFILVCFGVASLFLMRPAISFALFGIAFAAVWQMLLMTESGRQLEIMRLNALTAVVLSIILSAIIFHQYAKSSLLRRELEMLAGEDPLTLLPNRRELMARLQKSLHLAARSEENGCLLFIDLDHFKNINDTQSHIVGDLFLKEVAQRLVASVRDVDTVARFGGDEFIVMLENLGADLDSAARYAEVVSEKILQRISQPYNLGPSELHHRTASIGVALFSPKEHSADELMKQADVAMYQAKNAGRNTVRFYDAEMQARVLERGAMEMDLREAIAKGQLVLHYQPQVDSAGVVLGAEALVRWLHPQRGRVAPEQFIALAEEAGFIGDVGKWVLETACVQLARWAMQPRLLRVSLSVNMSSYQFRQTDIVDQVTQVLLDTGADPQRLKLELTESIMLRDVDQVIAKMDALKEKGITFSLDDFGTGYSSLSYLKRLPIDEIKIDQGFVRDILTDPDDAAIARMVIALAASMGLAVIAEGVETEAQRDLLADLGCHNYQGYLFSPALSAQEFEALLGRVPT